MAYFVIMSTTLFSAVQGVLDLIFKHSLTPVPGSHGHEMHYATRYWQAWMTPLIVLVLVMPLTQIKTLAVLVKVNSGGVLCVAYLLVFMLVASLTAKPPPAHTTIFPNILKEEFQPTFYYLAGMLMLVRSIATF